MAKVVEGGNVDEAKIPPREYQKEIAGQKLSDLEANLGEKYASCQEKYESREHAMDKLEASEADLADAKQNLTSAILADKSPEEVKELREQFEQAQNAAKEAEGELAQAESALEEASKEAEEVQKAVDEKKRQNEVARPMDKTYVVYQARISCSQGMRVSVIALETSEGVFIRGIPQMLIKHNLFEQNIVNFGGCHSKENPSTVAAAEEAVQAAIEADKVKKKEKGWFSRFVDDVIDFFCKPDDIKIDDSLLEQCVGECIAVLPVLNRWSKGKEKVIINHSAPLLRRGELVCNYGGVIILETSGQPE